MEYPIWGNETPPFSRPSALVEYKDAPQGYTRTYDITVPTLTIYDAKGPPPHTAILVLPGGGYEFVATEHEGHDIAQAFAGLGLTAATLKYRLPNPKSSATPHLVPLADALKALQDLRQHMVDRGVKEARVGVIGFSAGSHLATVMGLRKSPNPAEMPDFSMLIYGVTILSPGIKKWLEKALYHRPLTENEVSENTLLDLVNEASPPAFLVHAMDDDICHYTGSTLYAEALTAHSVEMEMHLFATGGHGFGLGGLKDGTDQWINLAASWLKRFEVTSKK